MKWFRHMADASDDEFLSGIEELFGWEGYGRWWKLLETIAKQMDGTNKCSAEYSWSKWQSFLKGKRNKLETFLVHCQDKRKIKLELNGNILKIFCPKLLELRDEYSRKSGHTPDIPPDNVAPEEETEGEEERTSDDYTREILKSVERIIQSPTPFFTAPITAWIGWGADYELDIRPSAERWKSKNPSKAMRSLTWLDEDIAKSIKQRSKPMPQTNEIIPTGFKSFAEIAAEKTQANIDEVARRYANTN